MPAYSISAQHNQAKTWQVRWAVSSFLASRTPVIQLGLQKSINSNWAISAEYGWSTYGMLDKKWYPDTVRENFTYQKFRAEVKHFTSITELSNNLKTHLYWSIEGVYMPERYAKQTDYFYRKGQQYDYYSSRIKSNVYATSFHIGAEWRFKQKLVLDTYAGLGPRIIYIKHHNTVFGYDPPDTGTKIRLFESRRDNTEGWHRTLHVALGFKLGYYIF
ncbi:hypothetical protein [Adhaeribacter pallidiroseus]|uniref:hypothetical protein n=1 Tax=Adhaeribacter pallidiroseus TaxID=2072847 RepID=UPI000E1C2DAB|nr:hypothetical protein [Adhaeribacter pallidiroseus]